MIGWVLADNLLIIYAFWELVGLSSYLLIGFWHEKDSAANASKKAFITNRIGDVGMLATMGYLWKKIDPAVWQRRLGVVYQGMYQKWWSDEINQKVFINGTINISNVLAWFDSFIIDGLVNSVDFIIRQLSAVQGWIDLYIFDGLVNLSAWLVGLFGRLVQTFQGGVIQRYILIMILTISQFIILKIF